MRLVSVALSGLITQLRPAKGASVRGLAAAIVFPVAFPVLWPSPVRALLVSAMTAIFIAS